MTEHSHPNHHRLDFDTKVCCAAFIAIGWRGVDGQDCYCGGRCGVVEFLEYGLVGEKVFVVGTGKFKRKGINNS